MKKNIVEYDILRVFALLLVVIGHCDYYDIETDYGGMYSNFDSINQPILSYVLYMLTRCIYTFHMPLFMALSGALWFVAIKNGGGNSLHYLVKSKFKRLIIPMFFTALFWSVPLKLISGYWDGITGNNLIKDIFLGQILMYGKFNSHLWFLQALFWCFIFSWIIEKKLSYNKKLGVIAFLFILSCFGIMMQSTGFSILNITSAFQYLLWFYVGYYFEPQRHKVNMSLYRYKCIMPLSIFSFICSWCISLNVPSCIRPLFYFINALLGMFAVYSVSYKLSNTKLSNSKVLRILSISSMGIYLYSDPINYLIIRLVIDSEILTHMWTTNIGSIALFCTRFIITFMLAFIVEIIINYKKYEKKI